MRLPTDKLRDPATVAAYAITMGVICAVMGAVGITTRLLLVREFVAGDPSMSFWRMGWGSTPMMMYVDRMTAVVAMGIPAGVVSLAFLARSAHNNPGRVVPAIGLCLQALWLILADVTFVLTWGPFSAFFRGAPAQGSEEFDPLIERVSQVMIKSGEILGYLFGLALFIIIVAVYGYASKAIVRGGHTSA